MFIPRAISAIGSHAADTSTRYALDGIHFERDAKGKPFAVATDGKRLISVNWIETPIEIDAQCSPVKQFATTLPVGDVASISKAAKPKVSTLRSKPQLAQFLLEELAANGQVSLVATDSATTKRETSQAIEGRFPKWRDVIPVYDNSNSDRITLDPQYLIDACKAIQALAIDAENCGVELIIPLDSNGEKPAILQKTGADGTEVRIVIMPMASAR